MSSIFVTSSGTDIGKTYVMCRIIQALRPTKQRLRALKPVMSGFDPAQAATSDAGRILTAAGLPIDARNLDAISPWRFRASLSPDMAAQREQAEIPFDRLVEFSRPARPGELTLVEGIGGVMVPLDGEHTVLDWIDALDAAALLVVGSYLGALSHSLTALAALASRHVEPLGIVISESADSVAPSEGIAATLERFAPRIPIVTLPRAAGGAGQSAEGDSHSDAALQSAASLSLLALLAPLLETL